MGIPRGLTMQFMSMMLTMLLYGPCGNVSGQLLPEPIVDTQYGQILGNRKLFEGTTTQIYLNEFNIIVTFFIQNFSTPCKVVDFSSVLGLLVVSVFAQSDPACVYDLAFCLLLRV